MSAENWSLTERQNDANRIVICRLYCLSGFGLEQESKWLNPPDCRINESLGIFQF